MCTILVPYRTDGFGRRLWQTALADGFGALLAENHEICSYIEASFIENC
jgi:hypothetical protein